MKKLELTQMENIEGGKFFGSETSCTKCYQGSQICITTYYAFWIPFSGGPNPMPC